MEENPRLSTFEGLNLGRDEINDFWQPLKQVINSHGYKMIKHQGKTLSVHRLIGLAFVPNPENKPFINHKNGLKAFNFSINLEWCNGSENNIHAINVLGYRNRMGRRKTLVYKDDVLVFEGTSVQATGRYLGCKSIQVSRVCSGSRNHYKGYSIKYAEMC